MAEYITCFEAEEGVSRANFNSRIEQMNNEFYNLYAEKGAPGGVAALNQNGKLVQMPTAADVGAAATGHTHTAADVGAAAASHTHAASAVTSGTFAADRIPELAAGKITSGTFDAARIPALSASKVTSGTFAATGVAAAAGTDYTTYRIRNIAANTSAMTAKSTALTNGNIYLQYE